MSVCFFVTAPFAGLARNVAALHPQVKAAFAQFDISNFGGRTIGRFDAAASLHRARNRAFGRFPYSSGFGL
ncbi:hypothetical protein [Bradyrhizobium sp. 199]|uniref:hypothetical protein n=1 Tax=Bradyrhizobium sp. 199 TaxID=2782664 RepID=UPI001FF9E68B|nr:hypothetical protein [Bradyrhizobium sp. 199]MCK1359855.1 hypothetical protein [Bradyrhizobium sp. 199]